MYLPFGRSISELLGFRQAFKDYVIKAKSEKKNKFLKYEELSMAFANEKAEYPWEFPGGKKLGAANAYRLALYFLNGYCIVTHEAGLKYGTRLIPEFDESPEEINEWCNVNVITSSPEAGDTLQKSLRKELDKLFKK